MAQRSLVERAREIVTATLFSDDEGDMERILVAGSVVERDGERYRIESGEESWQELEAQARHQEGLCDCGAILSKHGDRAQCRTCGREFKS